MNIFEYAKFKKMFCGGDVQANTPHMYIVSSVDELPSAPATNSVALVNVKYQSYMLNDSIALQEFYFSGFFRAQSVCFRGLACGEKELRFGGLVVYDQISGWKMGEFTQIDVYSPDETFGAWLNENGELFMEADAVMVYVYTRGEWMPVGEK